MKTNHEKENKKKESCQCPYCTLMAMITPCFEISDEFRQHMDNSKIEFLEALRTLIDDKIRGIKEKRRRAEECLTKIKIEDND